jgi:hypothetical protein
MSNKTNHKRRCNNPIPLGLRRVEDIPIGEFVKKVTPCGCYGGRVLTDSKSDPCKRCNGVGYFEQSKIYKRAHFAFNEKKYCLDDVDDISRQVTVKRGTLLLVGFTY